MPQYFDVVLVGMGRGGEVAASRLLEAGRSVPVVERELLEMARRRADSEGYLSALERLAL